MGLYPLGDEFKDPGFGTGITLASFQQAGEHP